MQNDLAQPLRAVFFEYFQVLLAGITVHTTSIISVSRSGREALQPDRPPGRRRPNRPDGIFGSSKTPGLPRGAITGFFSRQSFDRQAVGAV